MTTLDFAVSRYLLDCDARGLAEKTMDWYAWRLRGLISFVGDGRRQIEDLTIDDLRRYIAHERQRGLSRATMRGAVRVLKLFCGFAWREGMVDRDPAARLRMPRKQARHPRVLTVHQVEELLGIARGRNRVIVLFFLDTGVRLSELCNLRREDVYLQERRCKIWSGKGGKDRDVPMGRTLVRAMATWLLGSVGEYVFVSRAGDRLQPQAVRSMLRRLGMRAGFHVYPHLLRHTSATLFIANGGDQITVAKILGHSDVSTSAIYVDLAFEQVLEVHNGASPVDSVRPGQLSIFRVS